MNDKIQATIKNVVENNDVVLFMKGTKETPQCGFSNAVVNTLSFMNVDFKDVNVLDDDKLREGIKIFTDWPTIPQLYVKGEFVGGCDIIQDMYKSGELSQVLKLKNISHS
jgi:monothiol glutaredoxin, Grx4 family